MDSGLGFLVLGFARLSSLSIREELRIAEQAFWIWGLGA